LQLKKLIIAKAVTPLDEHNGLFYGGDALLIAKDAISIQVVLDLEISGENITQMIRWL
jgi:hypothetical protein